jgi:hypothetical protein
MEKIKWLEKVTNEQVLERVGEIISYIEKSIGLLIF